MKLKLSPLLTSIVMVTLLSSCAQRGAYKNEPLSTKSSYLKQSSKELAQTTVDNAELVSENKPLSQQQQEQAQNLRFMPPYKNAQVELTTAEDVLGRFSEQRTLTITADDLQLQDYLHYVLGEQLSVSYVLSDEVKQDTDTVTLNLQQPVTEKKLFTLTEELLSERDYVIRLNDNIFYIHKAEGTSSKGDIVYGYGKEVSDIPNTSLDILQMVPFDFGLQPSLPNTMRVLLGIRAQADVSRGVMTVQGKRRDIVKALELVRLLDRPTMQRRTVGAFKTTFLSTTDVVDKVQELMAQEGLKLERAGGTNAVISVVELETQGALIFFAAKQDLIERAVYWAKQVDKPIKTTEKQYFIYQPQYSRAADLGISLEALIGEESPRGRATSVDNENQVVNQRAQTARSASSETVKMVIDERANTLIFHTSGEEYQQLLPLVKRLDVLPKQVMLEVVIAEVSLTDEFKRGVEFAFSSGNYGISTTGAFMGEGFGGLSYLLQGAKGELAINMLETNSLVNILSRPSLVVRDGVNATINVGTDIPIVGETTSDPINGERQTTTVDYRQTGVELGVTPTVNARGVILMEIKQKISNEVESGSTVAGNPSVFERSIDTEVIAESGQTIILGGLISENRSVKDSKVPVLGDIPLLGNLFKADTKSGDKTELVVLVTPRVIESSSEWAQLKQQFESSLENLSISAHMN
ncbi:secretin N-terminal domain-containing protein [Pseudoalteromonas ruthenica]|uniref:secretin N-terminal domain-containing protein n=1 Tax=Pseudoalteromonas ruthenica TaxID=151081 RepID=UPI000344C82C|nr:secretin N-terminal domain-containing protein [Pseudoalteromonas ruthenica]